MPVVILNETQRRQVLDNVLTLLGKKFIGADLDAIGLRREHEESIVRATTEEGFEHAMNAMLRSLGVSHTGFFHESRPRATGRIALGATLTTASTPVDGTRWVFQDVHPGGVAADADLRTGDVLLTVDDAELVPPHAVPFTLGHTYRFTVRRPDHSTVKVTVTIPGSKEKQRPIVVPDQVVSARRLDDGVGLMKVSMFPGVLGMDVARDMSDAIADLACDHLIVDLRGNTGGGIGGLRLMSLLCPDRRGVGYSVTRARVDKGFEKERLPIFDHIPRSKLGVVPLLLRFVGRGRSVAVFTEALGTQRHHGRVVMLVNEHTASAAEMVAAFASENQLATLVGTKTAGRLVAGSAFKVGFGYRVMFPVAAYYTWHNTNLEGCGVNPTIEMPFSPAAAWGGHDVVLARALAECRATA